MTPRKQTFSDAAGALSTRSTAAAAPEGAIDSPAGEGCSSPAVEDTDATETSVGRTEAVLDRLSQQVSKLSRISQQLANTMADLEPSLAYPQVYAPANESDLRQQVRALEPQLAEARDQWVAQRSKASHAQMRRAGDLIKRAQRMCEGLRPVVVQSSNGMVSDDGSRMHRDYQQPAIVVSPGEVMAQAGAKRGS